MNYNVGQLLAEQEQLTRMWMNNAADVYQGNRENLIVYEGNVTGLSHYRYNAYASSSSFGVGNHLIVAAQPENKYDINATGLYLSTDQIGWIPKALNGPAAACLRKGLYLTARVMRHDQGSSDLQKRLFVRITACKTLKDSGTQPPWVKDRDIPSTFAANVAPAFAQLTTQSKSTSKETTMKSANQIIEQNISLGTSAAFLEAGRIANVQLSSIAGKKLPIMVRAYADTAVGRLLLANIALMAKDHFRPNDERLGKLVNAMTVSAYQEVLQTFDVEAMIDDMISNSTIKRALAKFDESSETVEQTPKKRAAKGT